MSQDLIIRNTPTAPSHTTNSVYRRDHLDASKHLSTMNISPSYRGKLKNKVVCVIDDYVTNGTTIEAVRALLEKAGVAKIIFVSIGRFMYGGTGFYKRQEYELTGDIFSRNFSSNLLETQPGFGVNAIIDLAARDEVERIKSILEGDSDAGTR